MKLVDILARELKVWPDCARYILFDHANSCYADLGQGSSTLGIDCSDFDDDSTDKSCTTVYRAQWQAAVDALKVAENAAPGWNGEGLPPVGTVCEWHPNQNGWVQVEILGHNGEETWFRREGHESSETCLRMAFFRQIRTPEQIAAEERQAAIKEMVSACPYPGSSCTATDCTALYDAGYRKQARP